MLVGETLESIKVTRSENEGRSRADRTVATHADFDRRLVGTVEDSITSGAADADY